MLIRVINGTVGHRPKDKNGNPSVFVEEKRRGDPPFDVDPEVAKRLVESGIAEYAEGTPTGAVATPLGGELSSAPGENLSDGENAPEGQETARLDPDQLQSMTLAELKKLAEDMGLDASELRKKSDVIDLITAEDVYAVEDGEAPPDLNAEAPVV